ncbi:MAG: PDZ domain-containing protein, partial [Anaerolineales bacterium]
MRRLPIALAAPAAIVLVVTATTAQEPDQFEGLRKELDKVSKSVQSQRTRIAELEKQLQARDQEIAELKKRLADAGAKPKPEAARAPALLGVAHEEPDADARAKLNLKEGQGAKVTTVHPGSPADKAGIKEGDILVSLGGKDVSSAKLGDVVRGHSAGDKLE